MSIVHHVDGVYVAARPLGHMRRFRSAMRSLDIPFIDITKDQRTGGLAADAVKLYIGKTKEEHREVRDKYYFDAGVFNL